MKIVVVGIGGIGGVLGARLAHEAEKNKENEIILFCRGKTLEAINKNGIEYRNGNEKILARARATDNANEIGKADVVFFAVKNYSLAQAANDIAPAVGDGTVVIPLLNGVQAYEVLKEKFPRSDVQGGCIYISAFIVEPGIVEQVGALLKIVFGGERADICEILKSAGIDALLSQNIKGEMWSKFCMISSLATATSLFKRNVGELFANGDSSKFVEGLLDEIISVASADGVRLPEGIKKNLLDKMRSFSPDTKTSMQRDFEKGGQNELDALTGYICALAAKLGTKTPLYDKAYSGLK